MSTRSVALLVLVAVLGLTIAPIASGAFVGAVTDNEADESTANASVSTFMQASAADTENTVESEMFGNKYNSSDNESRERLVLERADDLVDRLETLEEERAELREREDEHSIHPGEYQARMTQFTVEIRALEREIDRTEHRANETGVDVDRLDELRTNAANLTGPEVAEIARGLAGNQPGHVNGPPGDQGNQGNQGPPGDQADQDNQSNQSNQGPSNDRGPTDDDQNQSDGQETNREKPPDRTTPDPEERVGGDSGDDGNSAGDTGADSNDDRGSADEGADGEEAEPDSSKTPE